MAAGEILAEAGEIVTKAKAMEIERAGVMVAVADVEGKKVKIISNGMVDPVDYVPETVSREELLEAGINEKVRFQVINEIVEECGDDKEALLEQLRLRHDDLIPNHIIIDDIFSFHLRAEVLFFRKSLLYPLHHERRNVQAVRRFAAYCFVSRA